MENFEPTRYVCLIKKVFKYLFQENYGKDTILPLYNFQGNFEQYWDMIYISAYEKMENQFIIYFASKNLEENNQKKLLDILNPIVKGYVFEEARYKNFMESPDNYFVWSEWFHFLWNEIKDEENFKAIIFPDC